MNLKKIITPTLLNLKYDSNSSPAIRKDFMTLRLFSFILTASFILAGCSTISTRFEIAEKLTRGVGLKKAVVKTDSFLIVSYFRIIDETKPVRIYIEGDGYAWATRNRPSRNPTPINPLGLKLAAVDPYPNVVYLSRPCQYEGRDLSPECNEFYWTDGRFAEEVIKSMSQAVDFFIEEYRAEEIELVGYSGGAAVATLLAARHEDVIMLRTVAGNLDHERVNAYHRVSPLKTSLNPINVATEIRSLPQIHFVGERDNIVPPFIAESFLEKTGSSPCVKIISVPKASHDKGWVENWISLLNEN